MYQLLKQIVVTGIKTEAPPQPDEALRVAADRLRAEVLEIFAEIGRASCRERVSIRV